MGDGDVSQDGEKGATRVSWTLNASKEKRGVGETSHAAHSLLRGSVQNAPRGPASTDSWSTVALIVRLTLTKLIIAGLWESSLDMF